MGQGSDEGEDAANSAANDVESQQQIEDANAADEETVRSA